ncbi:MAG TPA: tRNA (adenosine(37)-N6)-threonylcarbamoyltransferase complex ATPase subunit type 1 TsaE [Bacteroidetes bacterium]|nr:tRNA (adenosine(37)-N6)-threonylcarbamoyltransferase complex ATPase subunit type 1 TsaE [Bacteroidota bacterium]
MGYEEYFYGGSLCLVEWGEKVADLLPPDPARITLRKTPEDDRDIDFFAR